MPCWGNVPPFCFARQCRAPSFCAMCVFFWCFDLLCAVLFFSEPCFCFSRCTVFFSTAALCQFVVRCLRCAMLLHPAPPPPPPGRRPVSWSWPGALSSVLLYAALLCFVVLFGFCVMLRFNLLRWHASNLLFPPAVRCDAGFVSCCRVLLFAALFLSVLCCALWTILFGVVLNRALFRASRSCVSLRTPYPVCAVSCVVRCPVSRCVVPCCVVVRWVRPCASLGLRACVLLFA